MNEGYLMADIFKPSKRSDIMKKVKSKNTKVELLVFNYLRTNKIYFQKHYQGAPGNPDIALPRKKRAVFIDGDFWHGRTLQRLIKSRGTLDDYWINKLKRNIERDKEQEAALISNGWIFIRVWESDLTARATRDNTLKTIALFLLN